MAKAPFPTIVALADPPSRLRRHNTVLGVLIAVTHVVWLVVAILLVDLLLSQGRIAVDDEPTRRALYELTGRNVPRGGPALLNAGIIPTVLNARGSWGAPALRWAYEHLGWARSTGGYLVGLLLVATLLGLTRLFLLLIQRRVIAAAAAAAASRLQRDVFLRDFTDGALEATGGARMAALLRESIPAVERGLAARMELFPREPTRVVALVLFTAAVNAWLGATFVLIGLLAWMIGSIALREATQRSHRYRAAHALAVERLAGLADKTRLIKGYAADEYFRRIYEERLAVGEQVDRRRRDFESWFGPAWGLAGLAGSLALIGLASQNILADRLGVSGAAGVFLAFVGVGWSGVEFFWRRRTLVEGEAAAVALERRATASRDGAVVDGSEFLPPLRTAIEFFDVAAGLPGEPPALQGFTARFPAGRRTALLSVGASQARAVVDLLNRFLDPVSGLVLFDGRDLRRATLESLRAQVCLVLKDELLFPDTVANNIGCGDHGFSRERLIDAAKQAHAHQFIERLPGGYECVVGDQLHPLTLGERYRIGLARAILRDPPVVVIEEPDEPLDKDSAELIDDALRRFLTRRTSLLIPTRWATLKIAEHVVILDRGRAVAAGPHNVLVGESPIYRYLLSTRLPDLPRTL